MIDDREKILARIHKTLALATSDNVNEAENAAAKAQELLLKYNVDEAELNSYSNEKNEKVVEVTKAFGGYNKKVWRDVLAFNVAKANLCNLLTTRTSMGVGHIWIGKPTNIEVAQYIFENLIRDLERLCEIQWGSVHYTEELIKQVKPYFQMTHGKTWKNSFYHGANQSIRERLNANLRQLTEAQPKINDMVVLNDVEIDEYMKIKYPRLSYTKHRYSTTRGGFEAGKSAGREVSFRTGVGAGGSSGPKLIGGG